MNGYDLDLVKMVSQNVSIPTIALGGAGSFENFRRAHTEGLATGIAAGSLFVYYGGNKGAMINYPEKEEIHF